MIQGKLPSGEKKTYKKTHTVHLLIYNVHTYVIKNTSSFKQLMKQVGIKKSRKDIFWSWLGSYKLRKFIQKNEDMKSIDMVCTVSVPFCLSN